LENKRKWRWGVNRWYILLFIILSIFAVTFFPPVRPNIQVAAEKLIEEPLINLGPLGDFFLTNTIPALIFVDLVVILLAFLVRQSLRNGGLVPRGISGVFEALIEVLYNLTETSAGKWAKQIFPWFASIVIVVLVGNWMKLIPGIETIGIMHHATGSGGYQIRSIGGAWYNWLPIAAEPGQGYSLTPFVRSLSTDLNFTVGLAIVSVFMTQVIGVRAQGFRFFSRYLNFTTMFKKPFFGFMDFLVGILETISELAKILSFSFRLFGNMFAGFVLVALVGTMIPIFVPSMIFMFEFFIGLIQAFVFGMLTLVFMAQATRGHAEEEPE
jgi:F-type H+-transporting ATPase subunit a